MVSINNCNIRTYLFDVYGVELKKIKKSKNIDITTVKFNWIPSTRKTCCRNKKEEQQKTPIQTLWKIYRANRCEWSSIWARNRFLLILTVFFFFFFCNSCLAGCLLHKVLALSLSLSLTSPFKFNDNILWYIYSTCISSDGQLKYNWTNHAMCPFEANK